MLGLIFVLAFAVGACGDSSDDGDANAGGSTSADSGGDTATEREAAAKLMPYLRERYNAADGKAYCAALTAAGRSEVEKYAATIPQLKARQCAKFISRFASKVVIESKAPQKPVRIKTVKVDGDKATVTMKGGMAGIRSTATYKLVKENGDWKLADPISGAKTRRLDG